MKPFSALLPGGTILQCFLSQAIPSPPHSRSPFAELELRLAILLLKRLLILSFQPPGISHDCVVSEPLLLLLEILPSMS